MKDKTYRYILFDLDGTLTDSEEGIIACALHAFRELGKPAPPMSTLRKMLGPPLYKSFREICGLPEDEAKRAVKVYRERYADVGLFENKPYEGVTEMLSALRDAGLTLAVSTCKPEPFAARILEKFGLSGYFAAVTGSGLDGSLDSKVEVIEETLSRLGCKDKTCVLMVGDRKYDIEGAAAAGVDCIGARWGYAQEGELESYGVPLAESFSKLTELIIKGHSL